MVSTFFHTENIFDMMYHGVSNCPRLPNHGDVCCPRQAIDTPKSCSHLGCTYIDALSLQWPGFKRIHLRFWGDGVSELHRHLLSVRTLLVGANHGNKEA